MSPRGLGIPVMPSRAVRTTLVWRATTPNAISLTVLDGLLAPETKIDRVIPSHSPPLRKADLRPVRDYYQKMLDGVGRAQRDKLTLDQTIQRLNLRSSFPNFRDPPPGHWAYGMHERNIRNLWRILGTEPETVKPADPQPPTAPR
jgi:hypothetical protein